MVDSHVSLMCTMFQSWVLFLHKVISNYNCHYSKLSELSLDKLIFPFEKPFVGVGRVRFHVWPAGGAGRQSLQRQRAAVTSAEAIMTHHSAMHLQVQNNTEEHHQTDTASIFSGILVLLPPFLGILSHRWHFHMRTKMLRSLWKPARKSTMCLVW